MKEPEWTNPSLAVPVAEPDTVKFAPNVPPFTKMRKFRAATVVVPKPNMMW